jgi:transposase
LTYPTEIATLVVATDEESLKEMITVEGWTTIRYLRAQGKSIHAIAKELSVARNTVRAALRSDNPPRYQRPKRSNPKLDPFADQIKHMLFQQNFIGSRILRELRKLGYKGGPTALYAYLRDLKADQVDSRLTIRFETPPAHQGQFDWSAYTVIIGTSMVKVVVFCLTLAFSRRKFYWPSLNATQASIFEALERGLHYFGGSPKELLIDNPRAFVDNADRVHFRWNQRFLELCGHYSLEPVPCYPGRARTKGKVERPFFYLEEHFIKGHNWASFDEFAKDLLVFAAEELDYLIHSTTRERPIDRFEQEKNLLTPLPSLPFVGTHEEMRKVSWDCLVSFDGSRYSVPWQYAGKQVWLRPSQGRKLLVRNQNGQEIAMHEIAARKGLTIIDPVHYEGIKKATPKTRVVLEESFLRMFPDHRWFIDGILIQHRNNGVDHLRRIMSIAELYSRESLLAAFTLAKEYNTYSHRFIRGLLESGGITRQRPTPSVLPQRDDESLSTLEMHQLGLPITADLGVYQRILEAGQ